VLVSSLGAAEIAARTRNERGDAGGAWRRHEGESVGDS
jgi:hypothetical protein